MTLYPKDQFLHSKSKKWRKSYVFVKGFPRDLSLGGPI